MKLKITNISSTSTLIILRLNPPEEIKPTKEFDEVEKFLLDLKSSADEQSRFAATNLETMVRYFDAEKEKEERQFKRHYEIPIDKQLFKEMKLNIDDDVVLELKKDE